MKTLVLTTSFGDNAPGKVYSALVKKLRENKASEIDVITTATNLESDNSIQLFKREKIHPRIRKLSVGCLGKDIFDYKLSKRILKKIDLNQYDRVISMISLHNFLPLYLGHQIKRNSSKIEWIVYSVDAIPPPKGWGTTENYRKGLIKMMNKFLYIADSLYFSNEVMLNYQLNLLDYKFEKRTGYYYTLPQTLEFVTYEKEENTLFNFLYTGGIYEARKPDELIKAFYDFTKIHSSSKFYFVGTNPKTINLDKYDDAFKAKVIFVGYTNDLKSYYKIANVLIDIDAAFDNDVFVSSKFFNYLMVDRSILCITGNNSPTSLIVKKHKIPDVFVAPHESDSILKAMLRIYDNPKKVERSGILNDEFRKIF